jgi:crossover junction endodeoxyribonuclease RuvC
MMGRKSVTSNVFQGPPCVLGIDPGFKGGLAFLGMDGHLIQVAAMPVAKGKGGTELDVPGLVGLIRSIQADHDIRLVVVERVHSRPGQGLASTFSFGQSTGEVLGIVKALGLPLERPLPQAWKKEVLSGTAKDKAAAIAYAAARFPTTSLLATARSRVPHEGLADAVCLAEHGRRLIMGRE